MRLMIVDDHAGVRKLIRQLVAAPGDTIIECASGEEAARSVREFKPDGVTMDVRMPGMCGFEATRSIRAAHPPARVVMVTSHDEPFLRREATDAGAAAFFPKENLAGLRSALTLGTDSTDKPDLTAPSPLTSASVEAAGTPPPLIPFAPHAGTTSIDAGDAAPAAKLGRALLVLMVGDDEADSERIRRELTQCGYTPVIERVNTEASMRVALERGRWDIVMIDHRRSGFGGPVALALLGQMGVELPALYITSLLEPEVMAQLLGGGASACISKEDLTNLCFEVENALLKRTSFYPQPSADKASASLTGLHAPPSSTAPAADSPAPPSPIAQETERRLRARIAELESERRALQCFAANVTHDLQAPLRAVNTFAAALQREHSVVLPDGAHDYLSRINSSCRLMSDRIERLLALARSEQSALTLEKVAMQDLVGEAWDEVCPEEERRRVVFKVESLPEVIVDRPLLGLVFVNLLANALKFSAKHERPLIEVGCMLIGRKAVFSVRDNGVGFDMQFARDLFQPFHRMHPVQEFSGTGLGLAMVQRIINRHGGCVWAEAAPNHGATFCFTLLASPLPGLERGNSQ